MKQFQMKLLCCLFLSAFVSFIAIDPRNAMGSNPFSSQPELRELGKIPDGIRVSHIPNPAEAHPGGRSGYKYTWKYKTTVEAIEKPISIREFGSFYWIENKWVFSNFTGKAFTPKDFSKWYFCPNAYLVLGTPCVDPSNWTGNNQQKPGKMLWLFIGRDRAGNQVKGYSVIELAVSAESTK